MWEAGRRILQEAGVTAYAFIAGDKSEWIDLDFTMTDWSIPTPYTMTLDLTGVSAGTIVTIHVLGHSGLEIDPTEFAAIPVVVGG